MATKVRHSSRIGQVLSFHFIHMIVCLQFRNVYNFEISASSIIASKRNIFFCAGRSEEERVLVARMLKYWLNFASNGNPSNGSREPRLSERHEDSSTAPPEDSSMKLPHWEEYSQARMSISLAPGQYFGGNVRIDRDNRCRLWDTHAKDLYTCVATRNHTREITVNNVFDSALSGAQTRFRAADIFSQS